MPFVYREIGDIGFYEVVGWRGATGAFTTRRGGVSVGHYQSLNLGLGGDDPDSVATNRRLLIGALGIGQDDLKLIRQVHGTEVFAVGAPDQETPADGYDAQVTDAPGTALGVQTADCVPILMYDPVKGAVAAVHAGWAGTLAGIAGRVVEKMAEEFGSRPRDILAAIGPSIGPCCYEVDEKVAGRLGGFPGGDAGILRPNRPGHWLLDLWEANSRVLVSAGLVPGNIEALGLCTACNPELFFSHRKSGGKAGRMMAIVWLKQGRRPG